MRTIQARRNDHRRGLTLVELLVSAMIMVVIIVIGAQAWAYGMTLSVSQQRLTVAGQIARADIEGAKVIGWANLPLGTLNGAKTEAVHTPAVRYFDQSGTPLANSTGAIYSVKRQTIDTGFTLVGSSYALTDSTRRRIIVSVTLVPKNQQVVQFATLLAKDGI